MNKELTFEKLSNLEATKLFKDLGYDLKQSRDLTEYSYEKQYDEYKMNEIVIHIFEKGLRLTTADWYHSEVEGDLNILPLMYPIMKLLEELQINIEQVYFNQIKGDGNE